MKSCYYHNTYIINTINIGHTISKFIVIGMTTIKHNIEVVAMGTSFWMLILLVTIMLLF